jgi:cobyrinic acid a,c-diamide synthase
MIRSQRLALALPADVFDPSFAGLALLGGLAAQGWLVQHFRCRARPFGTPALEQLTGLPGRHLDDWLMPGPVDREVFVRGSRGADLAVVEGTLQETWPGCDLRRCDRPGHLEPLRSRLDLPTIAVIPASRLDGFHLRCLPPVVDGIILDGVIDPREAESLARLVEMLARRPVVAAIEEAPGLREAVAGWPSDRPLPDWLIAGIAEVGCRHLRPDLLRALSESRPPLHVPDRPGGDQVSAPFRVAYAQDEAFGGYYPDTLELLESCGAKLAEFSPLRSEGIPEGSDLVLIGCGSPDLFADELAANVSLLGSLRAHVCRGRRLYAEGGGMAYLGRRMVLGDGRVVPGAGVLPLEARLRDRPRDPSPVRRFLSSDCWLGLEGTELRGYRCGAWSLSPTAEAEFEPCSSRSGTLTSQADVFFHHHAIGSLVHLHLGALPEFVTAFTRPHRPSLRLPGRSRQTS